MSSELVCQPPEKTPPLQQVEYCRPGWKGRIFSVPAQEDLLEDLACCIVFEGPFANCQY
jgi:hypothetical protein